MEAEGSGANLLAAADPAERESLARENVPDPLAGEQTWPTEEVLEISNQRNLILLRDSGKAR